MKYLKHFANAQEAATILATWPFNTISTVEGVQGASINLGVDPSQPNDEIWYTSSDGNIINPFSVEFGDGITIISNTYEDGKGVIKLNGNVTTIGSDAFGDCSGLTSIEIPDSVTSIGDGAFSDCGSLTSVEIPDSVTSIGSYAFSYCTSLISIEIPDGVTSIGDWAFYNCTGLTSIEIPDSVTSIGDNAFINVLHIYYNGTATGSPWGALAIN